MNIQSMKCPSCGAPLPTDIQVNQLIKCNACGNTLYLSDEEIDDTTQAPAAATPPSPISTVAELLTALNDPSVAVRVAAAQSLELVGDQSVIPELKRLLDQQLDDDTRQAIEHTLYELEPPGVAKTKQRRAKKPVDRKTRNTRAIIVSLYVTFGLPACLLLFCSLTGESKFVAWFLLRNARLNWSQGNVESAIEDYKLLIQFNPAHPAPYRELCQVYDELDEPEQVIDYCTRATELDPASAAPYYSLAVLYDDLGDAESALDHYIRYLELVEDVPEEEANVAYARERIEALGQ